MKNRRKGFAIQSLFNMGSIKIVVFEFLRVSFDVLGSCIILSKNAMSYNKVNNVILDQHEFMYPNRPLLFRCIHNWFWLSVISVWHLYIAIYNLRPNSD